MTFANISVLLFFVNLTKYCFRVRKNKNENLKKIRLREMLLLTKMVSIVKSFKNKIHLFLSTVKVDKKSYLLFEKEDYLILIYLERIFFDLFKNISFINDEHKKIRVFFVSH